MAEGSQMNAQILRAAKQEIEYDRATLARDAQYIADTATRYATGITAGEPDMGTAHRIAQDAIQLATLAARMSARTEALTCLESVISDKTA